MGQESTGIDNLEKDLKVEENTEVKKNNEEMMEGQKEQKKKIKKDISRENKMQIREFLDFLFSRDISFFIFFYFLCSCCI